ncbi:hypothetical protein J7L67_02350 [bacterium]|nr:hypothetical protein [bacterium]
MPCRIYASETLLKNIYQDDLLKQVENVALLPVHQIVEELYKKGIIIMAKGKGTIV